MANDTWHFPFTYCDACPNSHARFLRIDELEGPHRHFKRKCIGLLVMVMVYDGSGTMELEEMSRFAKADGGCGGWNGQSCVL